MSIQGTDHEKRDSRYDRWSGEERFLRLLANEIRRQRFAWRGV